MTSSRRQTARVVFIAFVLVWLIASCISNPVDPPTRALLTSVEEVAA